MRCLRFRPTSPKWRVYEHCTSFFCDSFDCLSRVPGRIWSGGPYIQCTNPKYWSANPFHQDFQKGPLK